MRRPLPHRWGSFLNVNQSQVCQDCGLTIYGWLPASDRDGMGECPKRLSDEFSVLMNLHRATTEALKQIKAERDQLMLDVDRLARDENASTADAVACAQESARLRRLLCKYAPHVVRDEPWFTRYSTAHPTEWDDYGGHGR